MRFALMTEPQQGMSYTDQLAIALRAEAAGFETYFRSDHYQSFPGRDDRPTTDAWAVLAGLARETRRIHLGTLVSPVTFRHAGNLAKVAATVDAMSGGRIEVGIGAGWNDDEHRTYGLPFPEIAERADMLEENLEILHGLWEAPDGWSYEGRHYRIGGARFRAKPTGGLGPNGRPRIIIGGESARSLRLAARYADELNVSSLAADEVREKLDRLDEACRAIGRDPATIARSAMVGVLLGRDRAEVDRRTASLIEVLGVGDQGAAWLEKRRARWIFGTPDEARSSVERFAQAGVERIMLQDFLPWDLEMVDLLGAELVGRV